MTVGAILESRPVRCLQELPTVTKVILVAAVIAAVVAAVYFGHNQITEAASFISSSGVLGIAELVRGWYVGPVETTPEETTFTLHSYVPDKLLRNLIAAVSEDHQLVRTTPLAAAAVTGLPYVNTFDQASSASDSDTSVLAHALDLDYNNMQMHVEALGLTEGDEAIAAHIRAKLNEVMARNLPSSGWGLSDRLICNALTKTFVELKDELPDTISNAQASLLLAVKIGERIYFPNAGVSGAAIFKGDGSAYQLTQLDEALGHPSPRTIGRQEGTQLCARPKITTIREGDHPDEIVAGRLYYQAGDTLVLGSRALWDYLSLDEIQTALQGNHAEQVEALYRLAEGNGAPAPLSIIVRTL